MEWARDRIVMGAERRSMVIDDHVKKMTAYHEVGPKRRGVSIFVADRRPRVAMRLSPCIAKVPCPFIKLLVFRVDMPSEWYVREVHPQRYGLADRHLRQVSCLRMTCILGPLRSI